MATETTTKGGAAPDAARTDPLTLEEVLAQEAAIVEAAAVRGGRRRSAVSALCRSGGGIRSATFGLGVIQALADRGVLSDFDYVSSVSGGGYIGAWLSAWACRDAARAFAAETRGPEGVSCGEN